MENGTDSWTMSTEILWNCGNIWIVKIIFFYFQNIIINIQYFADLKLINDDFHNNSTCFAKI